MGKRAPPMTSPPLVRIPKSQARVEDTCQAEEPLSPAARLFRQPQFNCHILVIFGLGKIVGSEELKAVLQTTLVRHPRFSSIQITDEPSHNNPRWIRTNVNLDEHVIYPDLASAAAAAAADPVVGDRIVEEYATNLYNSPLDPSHPLWDLHILAVPTSEAACVAVFRIHHSLGDGISLMSLFLACTCRTSDFVSLPSLPKARRRPAASSGGFRPWALFFLLWTFLVYVWNTIFNAFLFVLSAFFLKDSRTIIMGSEGVEFRPKRFVHRTLSLDDVKGIKNALGCTINDVLVGVTSAALSLYLSRSYDGRLPNHLRIRSSLLVNIRSTPGINALAEMMKQGSAAKWGNHVAYVLLNLPVTNCESPLDYIRKGMAAVEKKKKSWEAILINKVSLLIVKTLGSKVGAALCHRVISNITLSFSNVVGPTEEVGFCGSPLVYIAPSVYGHPQALTIHYQSYANKMVVVLAVDEAAIPDPHKLLSDIACSLQLIKDAATANATESP